MQARTCVTFRCDPDVLENVRAATQETQDTQSTILRQAMALWRECRKLEPGQALAIVDRTRRNKVVRNLRVG